MNLQLFRHELDEVDLKFVGFIFTLSAVVVLSALGLKEVVMAIIAILGAIVRDLYRTSTNDAKQKGDEMKIIALIVGLLMLAGVANAVEPKVSYSYEITDSQFVKLLGISVKEDVSGIKGLDFDAWYLLTPPETELKYDEIDLNNLVMPGISYSKEIKGIDVGLNLACGLDRIEKLTNVNEIGEFKVMVGVCIGKKW